jgi:hypothetical protein
MVITDSNENLLPHGTVVDLKPLNPHTGIVGYLPTGQQAVIHNSKKHGKAVLTLPEELNDGKLPIRIVRLPLNAMDGMRIWNNAIGDVQRRVSWTVGDNCEDLVSRATTGQSGSPTRNAVVLFGLAALLLWGLS